MKPQEVVKSIEKDIHRLAKEGLSQFDGIEQNTKLIVRLTVLINKQQDRIEELVGIVNILTNNQKVLIKQSGLEYLTKPGKMN